MTPRLPRLIVITDWDLGSDLLFDRVASALSAGPEVAVQHRHPLASTRLFLEQGRALKSLCERHRNPLFVNGRLDVALALKTHLHLPSRTLLPEDVRPHLGPEQWLSMAVHDADEAAAARGADLVLISPVSSPGSKKDNRQPLGIEGFERLASLAGRPAYALGGISPADVPKLPRAAGFAAISSVLWATDPASAASAFLQPRS